MQLQFKKRPGIFLSLSIFLHALIVFVLLFHQVGKYESNKNLANPNLKKPKEFEVTYIPDAKIDTNNLKQIVNSEAANKIKTEAPKYLSQFDNKTDRETIARNVDVFYRGDKSQATNVSKKTQKNKDSSENKKEKINLANLGLGAEQLARIEVAKNVKKNSDSEGGDLKRASSNNDYIKNAQLGDITNLNTAEYKFYGFYARIRGQLEQYWGNELKSKSSSLFKKGRSIASGQELITNLEITIDKEGKIIKVAIVTTSGVREIDEAAIDAFEKAGPFPNPPKELVLSGEAILRWGFVVRS